MNAAELIALAKTSLSYTDIQELVGDLQDHLQEIDRQKQLAARKYGKLIIDDLTGKTNYVAYDETGKIVRIWPKRTTFYAVVIWDTNHPIEMDNFAGFATEAALNKALAKYCNMAPLICKLVAAE